MLGSPVKKGTWAKLCFDQSNTSRCTFLLARVGDQLPLHCFNAGLITVSRRYTNVSTDPTFTPSDDKMLPSQVLMVLKYHFCFRHGPFSMMK